MEKESRAQALKNTRLLATLNDGEESAESLLKEIDALKGTVSEKDSRIAEVTASLKALDLARDAMQNELDQYQENDLALRKDSGRSQSAPGDAAVAAGTNRAPSSRGGRRPGGHAAGVQGAHARMSAIREENR